MVIVPIVGEFTFLSLGSVFWVVVPNIFHVHPYPWGNDPIWRAYFSKGLVQPPTSFGCLSKAIFFVGLGVVSATLFALYIIACVQAGVSCFLKNAAGTKSLRNPQNRVCNPKKRPMLKPEMKILTKQKYKHDKLMIFSSSFFEVIFTFHVSFFFWGGSHFRLAGVSGLMKCPGFLVAPKIWMSTTSSADTFAYRIHGMVSVYIKKYHPNDSNME